VKILVQKILKNEMSDHREGTSFLTYDKLESLKINTPPIRNRVVGFYKEGNIKNRFYKENRLKVVYKNIPLANL
jgi:hypothetical protein